MNQNTDRNKNIKKFREWIKDIRFAMLTMVEDDGRLRSRPRATQYLEFDSNFWFFTKAEAPKVDEVQHDQHVNLSYAAPNDQKYVSVSGTTQLASDRKKIEQLWNPLHKVWFQRARTTAGRAEGEQLRRQSIGIPHQAHFRGKA
jgi:general stress protein 26